MRRGRGAETGDLALIRIGAGALRGLRFAAQSGGGEGARTHRGGGSLLATLVIALAVSGCSAEPGAVVDGGGKGRAAASGSAAPRSSAEVEARQKRKDKRREKKREKKRAAARASASAAAADPTSAPRMNAAPITTRDGASAWREALGARAVVDAPAGAPITWKASADCPLEWAVRSSILETKGRTPRVAPEGPALEAILRATVDDPEGPTLVVKDLAMRTATGLPLPGRQDAAARVALGLRDGGRVLAPRQESPSWHRIEGFAGWGALFPTLPIGGQIGAGATWPLRSSFAQGAAADAPPVDVHVEVERWVTLEGSPVALLTATWTESIEEQATTPGPRDAGTSTTTLRGSSTSQARWAVTGAGRLLFAWTSRVDEGELAVSRKGSTSDARRSALDVEARLVSACDGPTLARFATR